MSQRSLHSRSSCSAGLGVTVSRNTIPAGLCMSPAMLKLDPAWDPLRKDARFQKLIDDGNTPVATKS